MDIWDASDQFQFVYQPVTGDTEIVAYVAESAGSRCVVESGTHDPRRL